MIVEDGEARRTRPKDVGQVAYDRMVGFTNDLQRRGVLIASDSLQPDALGVRISTRGGQRQVVDGPFTESKEIIGGFFFINVKTKKEAVEIASVCPANEWATVEVRGVGPCW